MVPISSMLRQFLALFCICVVVLLAAIITNLLPNTHTNQANKLMVMVPTARACRLRDFRFLLAGPRFLVWIGHFRLSR